MDPRRFDALAKTVASFVAAPVPATVVGAATGGLTALVSLDESEAAVCRAPGDICREHANCCSKTCGLKDRTGRRTCQCRTAADCSTPSNKCRKSTCTAGVCGTAPAVTCTALDQCHQVGTCDPATGVCSTPIKPAGTACDAGVCTTGDTCQNGVCTSSGVSGCGPLYCCQNGDCVATSHPDTCRAADGTCAAGGTTACPCCDSALSDTCVDACPGGTTCVGGDCQ